jgi:DNA primase
VYDVDDWPIAARLWFFKAGLSRADIGNLNAYWHVPSERVVLQYQDFWIARALDKQRQPKYLSGDRRPELIVRWGSAPVPTLCEDILSAYKVGLVAEGWAVLGTKIPDAVVAALLQRRSANVWLDPDPAGQRAAARITRQLKAYGVTVRNITSARDPKLHTLEDIFHATR